MEKEKNQTIDIALAGLSCQKCVAKLTAALQALPSCDEVQVSKRHAVITGNVPFSTIERIITDLGYQVVKAQKIILPVQDLSTAEDLIKLEKALLSREDVFALQVDNAKLTLKTTAEEKEILSYLTALGYQIKENHSPPKNPPQRPHFTEKMATHRYLLEGISCASCVKSIEDAIYKVEKVEEVRVNFAAKTALVFGLAEPAEVMTAVQRAGYDATLNDDLQTAVGKEAAEKAYRTQKQSAIIALLLGLALMLAGFFGLPMTVNGLVSQIGWGIVAFLTLGLLVTVGKRYFANAWQALHHQRATMDTLVALGIGAAWLYSSAVVIWPDLFPVAARHVYFEATAMILGLITLGQALETRAKSQTSAALNHLIALQPQQAIIVDDQGEEKACPLAEVMTGMTLRLKAGATVPVDGTVIAGDSYVDESMLTGEPLAVHKTVGDTLQAGTINQGGTLLFTATKIGEETMLSRIIALVDQAQSSKPALAKLADRIASIFVPMVVGIATITAIIWLIYGVEPKVSYALITSISVLIIACPCALGLATPLSVTTGVGRVAELGILVRDAQALQLGAVIDTVVLDKTGTITAGKPQLTAIHPLTTRQDHLLAVAKALEKPANHPLATAILNYGDKENIAAVDDFQTVAGKGVKGLLNQLPVALGNAVMMEELGVDLQAAEKISHQVEKNGETPVFVAENNQLLGVLGISDPVREQAVQAITALKDLGLNVIMLTGDTAQTAAVIGEKVGITQIVAGVLPDKKATVIRKLQQTGKKVAMVGDGINDAPALAQADVGMAMRGGSDVAIESAAFTLMRQSLIGAVDALALSRATLRNMKGNLLGAFIYNIIGIPIAAGVLFPWTGILLNPALAGGAMALSSLTVVYHAKRLSYFQSPLN